MSTKAIKQSQNAGVCFAVCVDNSGYPASLELHKIYRVVRDPSLLDEGIIRVFDESGEDYLYPAKRFLAIEVPQELRRRLSRAPTAVRPTRPRRRPRGC